jgi:hypothetical protein
MRLLLLLLLALQGASPAAGKDLPPALEPQDPPRALATVPGDRVEAYTHPGSPRTSWRVREIVIEEYRAPGSRRSDFSLPGGRVLNCYESFTGRVDCK